MKKLAWVWWGLGMGTVLAVTVYVIGGYSLVWPDTFYTWLLGVLACLPWGYVIVRTIRKNAHDKKNHPKN